MSDVKSDENVLFFPTAARLSDGGEHWLCPIHGWIFEPELDSRLRSLLLAELQELLGLDRGSPPAQILEERLRPFLYDNERSKQVTIRVGGERFTLSASEPDGHFRDEIRVPRTADAGPRGHVPFAALLRAGDQRAFRGVIHLLPPEGWSIISDIDDTIKITDVRNRPQLLRNTFLEQFRAVEGMAALYARWVAAGARLHFVSNSPHQLFLPLSEFAATACFPAATWHLKRVRMTYSSVVRLLQNPPDAKRPPLESLLEHYPRRRFILVGDTGESDPELYGWAARRYPDQIRWILLRDVTGESRDANRYRQAFADVPGERWQLFTHPDQIKIALD